jgi:perosamine synthetase
MKKKLFCDFPGVGLKEILGFNPSSRNIYNNFWKPSTIFMHSGRIAIRKACELVDIKPGDEVLMPSYNCGSEVDPVIRAGATVVLYRVARSSMIDIDDLVSRISVKTKIIYITHYFGFPQSMAGISEICRKKSILMIEDCALSLFSGDHSIKLGARGDIAIFSLVKTLPVPDGGALIINNANIKIKTSNIKSPKRITVINNLLPLLKFKVLKKLSNGASTRLLYIIAFNTFRIIRQAAETNEKLSARGGRPGILPDMYYDESLSDTNISALSKRILRSLDSDLIIKIRRRNFELLNSLLEGCDFIEPLFSKLPEGVCPLYFPVLVDNRNDIHTQLNKVGIGARAFWMGYHPAFPWDDFPDACHLKDRVLALPINQELSPNDIKYIANETIRISSDYKNHLPVGP